MLSNNPQRVKDEKGKANLMNPFDTSSAYARMKQWTIGAVFTPADSADVLPLGILHFHLS